MSIYHQKKLVTLGIESLKIYFANLLYPKSNL